MQVPSNNAGVSAPAYPEQASGSANRHPNLYSFAGLLDAVVIGSPDVQQLQRTAIHFRELGSTEDGAAALRGVRIATQQYGRYPTLVFHDDLPLAIPLLSLRHAASGGGQQPGQGIGRQRAAHTSNGMNVLAQAAGILHSEADEALRAAVAEVCQIQINMMTQQSNALIARIVADMARHLAPSSADAQAAASAGGAMLGQPPAPAASGSMRLLQSPLPVNTIARREPYRFFSERAEQPLATVVCNWLGLQKNAELESRWNEIDQQSRIHGQTEQGLAFKKFLIALTDTHIFQCPTRRAEVSRWLTQAAQPGRETMRAAAFEICVEGSTMCRDNALLIWNRLNMLMQKDDAIAGHYAGRLQELCHLALRSFRMETLEGLAQEKIMDLHKANKLRDQLGLETLKIDPVETMLNYQIDLREDLQLPVSVTRMAFPLLSRLTQEDLQNAKNAITRAEAENFHTYLMLDFTPFLAEVRRQIGPAKCQEVSEILYRSLDGFDALITQSLDAFGIPVSEDARREMGVRVQREIEYTTWLPYANAVLARASLMPLPTFRMPPPGSSIP